MARELAKCLPEPHRRGNGCIRTGGGIVTWAYGHVLQQAEPQDYDPKYKRWNAEDLPIIPTEWKLLISPASKEQFHIIEGLISSPDVDAIVNAGDPDREGSCSSMRSSTTSETKSPSSASCSTPSMKKAFMNP